jgi:hypothetical protein
MSRMSTSLGVFFAGAAICIGSRAVASDLTVWAVDPHTKVFRDSEPGDATRIVKLRAAGNEFEPGQVALRAPEALENVGIEVTALTHEGGEAKIEGGAITWNFVGFIPLAKNTPRSDRLQVRAAPCQVPDPLLAARTIGLEPNATQPVWITVRVPQNAVPGRYRAEIAVAAGDVRETLPIELTVDPFNLPDERHLFVTNWFRASSIASAHGAEIWSEAFWSIFERYAKNMAEHRQNVVLVPWTLIEITREPDGTLTFDYRRFDRFVELFEKVGAADRIEISHVGHFGPGGWSGNQIVLRKITATDRASGKQVTVDFDSGLSPLLADLERHLAQRGWLEKSMIHVADEPSINNVESWREASGLVRRAAPHLRRIDAIEGTDFSGALEVWVPKLSHFDRWRDAYEARRGDGEFWYYICCHPYGNVYPNRFLDYPTACVRVLHWINFAADLRGYLHWGLTFWGDDPFGTPSDRLPPGDTHAIYPGSDGPLNSIRWEIQRESIEDFEYLHLLVAKTAEAKRRLGSAATWVDDRRRAMELCQRVVPGISHTEKDPVRIMATRRAIADEIIALGQAPLLLIQTEPPAGSTLVDGPILVELRGATEPGTSVKVNGRLIQVGADGVFACGTRPTGESYEITIEAERDGNKKVATRRFRLQE